MPHLDPRHSGTADRSQGFGRNGAIDPDRAARRPADVDRGANERPVVHRAADPDRDTKRSRNVQWRLRHAPPTD